MKESAKLKVVTDIKKKDIAYRDGVDKSEFDRWERRRYLKSVIE